MSVLLATCEISPIFADFIDLLPWSAVAATVHMLLNTPDRLRAARLGERLVLQATVKRSVACLSTCGAKTMSFPLPFRAQSASPTLS